MDPTTTSAPNGKVFYDQAFPLVYQNDSRGASLADTCAWAGAKAARLDREAAQHGVLLFRGFPLVTDRDFDAFVSAFGFENFTYRESLSNAVRLNRTERVFTANEAPPEVTIFLHHEMAQTPIFPSKLFFFCERAADEGGATPICRSDALFERISEVCPGFARNCEEKGLRYTNVMPPKDDLASGMGRSWRSTLSVESKEEAAERLGGLGYTAEWLEDDCLRATTPVLPAVRTLASGRKAFFNQLIAAFQGWKDSRNDPSRAITFGDGSPLDVDATLTACSLAEEFTVDLAWQHGDVALVD
ncbi:MAG: SyrP protein, partial [Akkermansiaceae bacterium]|nr:SyrP protein [Akkermansiaceae bacterium]